GRHPGDGADVVAHRALEGLDQPSRPFLRVAAERAFYVQPTHDVRQIALRVTHAALPARTLRRLARQHTAVAVEVLVRKRLCEKEGVRVDDLPAQVRLEVGKRRGAEELDGGLQELRRRDVQWVDIPNAGLAEVRGPVEARGQRRKLGTALLVIELR